MREIPSFVYDPSLVLYAPLWKRDGTSFIADDARGRLMTVTGATWGSRGRSLDNIDDKITFPDTGFPSGATNRTLLMWVKPTTATKNYQEFFFYGTEAGNQAILFSTDTNPNYSKLLVGKYLGNSGNSTGLLVANVWQQIGFILSGTDITFIINGVSAGTTTLAGINTVLTGTSGQMGVGWNSSYMSGTGGELAFWGRALSLLEAQNIYLATNWRYQ